MNESARLTRVQLSVAPDAIELTVAALAAATDAGFTWDVVDTPNAIGTVDGTRMHVAENRTFSTRALLEVTVPDFDSAVDRVRATGADITMDLKNLAVIRIAALTIVLLPQLPRT